MQTKRAGIIGLALLLVSLGVLLLVQVVLAQEEPPPRPGHSFFGPVTIGGSPAPVDSEIRPKTGSLVLPVEPTGGKLVASDGTYGILTPFTVLHDDLSTTEKDGAVNGDPITFFLVIGSTEIAADQNASPPTFTSSDATELALTFPTVGATPAAANVVDTTFEDSIDTWTPSVNDPDTILADLACTADAASAQGGVVTVNSDCSSGTYDPPTDFNGADSFNYEVCDPGLLCDSGTVSYTVDAVNDVPGFTPGPDDTVLEDSGARIVAWATDITAGPADEAGQALTFNVSNDNNALFSVQPSIDAAGTLTYTPVLDANGVAIVDVALQDDGGTANGGVDTSATVLFQITVTPVNDVPSFTHGPDDTVLEDSGVRSIPWATDITAGPADEIGQVLTFNVTNDNNALFSVQPSINVAGTLIYTPALNASGVANVDVSLQDDGGTDDGGVDTSATVNFQINVTLVNDAPILEVPIVDVTVDEGAAEVVLDLSGTFSDADLADAVPDALTLSVTANDNTALVDDSLAGTDLTLVFQANQNGVANITIRATDVDGAFVEDFFLVNVIAVNDDPTVAVPIADVTVDEDAADVVLDLAATFADVDIATNGDVLALSVSANDNPTLVDATLGSPNLTLDFQADQNGVANVTIRATDTGGAFVEDTFLVTVNPVSDIPVANDDFFRVGQVPDSLVVSDPGVLGNDTDADDDDLTAVLLTPPVGELALDPAGGFAYTPPAGFGGFDADDTFVYRADDGPPSSVLSNSATDTTPSGRPFFGEFGNTTVRLTAEGLGTHTEATISFDLFVLKSWDGNPGDVWDLTVVGGPTLIHTTFSNVAAAQQSYPDSFPGGSNPARTGAAESNTLGYTFFGDTVYSFTFTFPHTGSLLELDFTGSGLQALSDESWGLANISLDVDEGFLGDSSVATVTIRVNDAPLAVDDPYATGEDTALIVGIASGVLANDSDPNPSDTLTVKTADSISAQGAAVVVAVNGSFTYDPTSAPALQALRAGVVVVDTFSYIATDGDLDSDPSTVSITVTGLNDAPVANDDAYPINEDTILTVLPGPGVLFNDTDVDAGDVLTVSSADNTSAQGAPVAVAADGSFTYDPTGVLALQALKVGEQIVDTFAYTVTDGTAFDSATVSITVIGVNDPPVAVNDSYTTSAAATLVRDAATGVLSNDTDVEGDPLTAVLVDDVTNGVLDLSPDGSFTYTPGAGFPPDTFTYQAFDGTAPSNLATVTIRTPAGGGGGPGPGPSNQAPVAVDQSVILDEDTTADITLEASDDDGDDLTFSILTDPANGTLGPLVGDQVAYTPNPDYNGPDSFTFRAADPDGETDDATITLTVEPVNDAPEAVDDSYSVDQGQTLGVFADEGVLANDIDVDGDPLTAVRDDGPSNGTLSLGSNGSFTYTPDPDFFGDDTFTYHGNDELLDSNIATVRITVVPALADEPPTAVAAVIPLVGNEGETLFSFDASLSTDTLGIVSREWNFNLDASSETGIFVFKTFPDNGNGVATLTVTDTVGQTDVATVAFTVLNLAPLVNLTGPDFAVEGDTNTYNFSFSDPGDDTFTANPGPDCGVGGVLVPGSLTVNATGGAFACSFPDGPAGPTVSVQVTDDDGALSNVSSIAVEVSNVAPALAPLAGQFILDGSIAFSGDFTDPGTLDNHIVRFNPGDGSGIQACLVNSGGRSYGCDHDFGDLGSFTGNITIDDGDGGTDSVQFITLFAVEQDLGNIRVISISAPDEVLAGLNLDIEVTVQNVGSDPIANARVEILRNGQPFPRNTISLGRLASSQVIRGFLTTSLSEAGQNIFSLGDKFTSVTVPEALLIASNLQVGSHLVASGDEVKASFDVENVGGEFGSRTLSIAADGVVVKEFDVFLGPDQSAAIIHKFPVFGPGAVTVALLGPEVLDTERIVVTPPLFDIRFPPFIDFSPLARGFDRSGNPRDVTGPFRFGLGSVKLVVPVNLPAGEELDRLVDPGTGISIIGTDFEVPVRDPVTGEVTIRLQGVLLTPLTGDGVEASAVAEEVELESTTKERDLSADDPRVGRVATSVEADLIQIPDGAQLTMLLKRNPSDEDRTGLEQLARRLAHPVTGGALTVGEIAVTVVIETNLSNETDVGEVRFNLAIGQDWVDAFIDDPNFILAMGHISGEGDDKTFNFLGGECEDPNEEHPGQYLCQVASPAGFSIFSLLALVPLPATLNATGISITPPVVEPDEPVVISAEISNTGAARGSRTVILQINGVAVDSAEITVQAGQTGTVRFFVIRQETGVYNVEIEGQTATFEVAQVLSPEDIEVLVVEVQPTADINPGDDVDITAFVRNTGGQNGSAEIRLFINDQLNQVKTVTVAAGDSEEVTFRFNPPAGGEYDVRIGAATTQFIVTRVIAPALFRLSDIQVLPAQVRPGEPVTISVVLANDGGLEGERTVLFLVGGLEVERQTISLAGQSALTLSTQFIPDAAGTLQARVQGEGILAPQTRSFIVLPDPQLTVTSLVISPVAIAAGGSLTITAEVTNAGDEAGDLDVRLTIDGAFIEQVSVTVPANQSRTADFSRVFPDAGTFQIAVNGLTRTVTVRSAEEADLLVVAGSLKVEAATVSLGDPVTVSFSVRNAGESFVTQGFDVTINDVVVASRELTVAPGATVPVTITVITDDLVLGRNGVRVGDQIFALTVEADIFVVSGTLQMEPSIVTVGDSATVTLDVRNQSAGERSLSIVATIDGVQVGEQSVTLDPGETLPFSFEIDTTGVTVGTRTLRVDGETFTLTVLAVEADIFIVLGTLQVEPSTVTVGDSATVTLDVRNQSTGERSLSIVATIDGLQVEEQSVTLDPGETRTVSFDIDTTGVAEGTRTLRVDGETFTLQLEAEAAGGGGIIIIIVIVLAIALAGGGGGYFLYRRRQSAVAAPSDLGPGRPPPMGTEVGPSAPGEPVFEPPPEEPPPLPEEPRAEEEPPAVDELPSEPEEPSPADEAPEEESEDEQEDRGGTP